MESRGKGWIPQECIVDPGGSLCNGPFALSTKGEVRWLRRRRRRRRQRALKGARGHGGGGRTKEHLEEAAHATAVSVSCKQAHLRWRDSLDDATWLAGTGAR